MGIEKEKKNMDGAEVDLNVISALAGVLTSELISNSSNSLRIISSSEASHDPLQP
jgi:hypothetical protein